MFVDTFPYSAGAREKTDFVLNFQRTRTYSLCTDSWRVPLEVGPGVKGRDSLNLGKKYAKKVIKRKIVIITIMIILIFFRALFRSDFDCARLIFLFHGAYLIITSFLKL